MPTGESECFTCFPAHLGFGSFPLRGHIFCFAVEIPAPLAYKLRLRVFTRLENSVATGTHARAVGALKGGRFERKV